MKKFGRLKGIFIASMLFLVFGICGICNAGTERNYLEEISKLTDPESLMEYAKRLKLEDILQFGKQVGMDAQEKLHKGEDKDQIIGQALMGLGLIMGPWSQVANEEEIYNVFMPTISDKNEPLYWRYVLVDFLSGVEVKELEDIKVKKEDEPQPQVFSKEKWITLIDALHKILLSNDEDLDLRLCSCRSVTALLHTPTKKSDTDITKRIEENISSLQKILKDPKEPVSLREAVGRELRAWYSTGVRCIKSGRSVDVPNPEQIKTDILQSLTNKETNDLGNRVLIATNAYLQDESFIPVLEDLLTEVKDEATQKKIKKILREIKRACKEER